MSKDQPAPGELTGKKFAAILVGGFGIVIAVNLTMARYAITGFSGTVVDNSYVASQKFNGWLDEAKRENELGWSAELLRQNGRLIVTPRNIPMSAEIRADIRKPLGEPDSRTLTFSHASDGNFVSEQGLPEGRWIIRIKIESDGRHWVHEEQM